MKEISDWINSIVGPAGSSTLVHALVGIAILIIGLFAVKIVASIFRKMLLGAPGLTRANSDGSTSDFATPIAKFIKAILTVFVLMIVLEHFSLTNVLDPLKDMVNEFLAAVPNIVGAGAVAFAGWVIAKIVSEFAKIALGQVDAQIAKRAGNDSIKISNLGAALIFAAILLPVSIAALGVLNIPAITDPASNMINKLMTAVPNVIGAFIILLVVYVTARFVVFVLRGVLEGMSINELPQKIGLTPIFNDDFTPIKLIEITIMFFAMVSAAAAAVNVLQIDVVSEVFAGILKFGGGLLVGGLILIVGNFLGNLVFQKLSAHGNQTLANLARIAILGLVLAMGLKAMGLADNIVTIAFGATIGSVAVAVAIAFGWGGRDAAKSLADKWARRIGGE